jgi:hypothetical protein
MSLAPLDMRDPTFRADPYPTYAHLREHEPVHRDAFGIWLVTRHADVARLNRDPRLGRDLRRWNGYAMLRPYLADTPMERCAEAWMFRAAPLVHARLGQPRSGGVRGSGCSRYRPQSQSSRGIQRRSAPLRRRFAGAARGADRLLQALGALRNAGALHDRAALARFDQLAGIERAQIANAPLRPSPRYPMSATLSWSPPAGRAGVDAVPRSLSLSRRARSYPEPTEGLRLE